MASSRRALHYVFKIADRKATIDFYLDILGMRVLRHEEFEEGCKASCNGRRVCFREHILEYDGHWSKTMIGYGPEDTHFVMELTYNYGVADYKQGNEFQGVVLQDMKILERAKAAAYTINHDEKNLAFLKAPGGFRFYIINEPSNGDPVKQVIYSCTNLDVTKRFWVDILGCEVFGKGESWIVVAFDETSCSLKFQTLQGTLDRAVAYGRVAFSCPKNQLPQIESLVKQNGLGTVITPLISLDTPGKATVDVVILGDPDGHEICFVGDEAFRELSQPAPGSYEVLKKKIDEFRAWKAQGGRF